MKVSKIFKGYGLFHFFYLAFCFFFTKVFFREARIIRLPFFIRNNGRIKGMENLTTGRSLRIDVHKNGEIIFGKDIEINDNCQIACSEKIEIGDNVLIASKVFITDHDHSQEIGVIPTEWNLKSSPVKIGKRCWLGNNVSILKGVNLGDDCVVAAGSVVTKSFNSKAIIAGVPAKEIKVN